MNPLGNYIEENKAYLQRLFSGNMKVSLVICYECKNLYLTETGPNFVEFSSSCCPFCGTQEKSEFVGGEDLKEQAERIKTGKGFLANDEVFTRKVKDVLLHGERQRYNVAACTNCNNRFIYLHDDGDEIGCCPFCMCEDELEELITNKSQPVQEAAYGMERYVGRLFYLELKNKRIGNFILSDVDQSMERMRFVSLEDDRMAFWIRNDEIETLMEFIKIPNPDEMSDPSNEE